MAFCCGLSRVVGNGRRYDVVFDFDGTLVKGVRNSADRPDIIAAGNGLQVSNGSFAILAWLASKENVRLTFFSAGQENRNTDLLKQLGTNVRHLGSPWRNIQVFHDQDRVNNAKDLTRLSRRFDLASTVLVDDTHSVCADGQERNLLGVASLEQDHERAEVSSQARAQARNNMIRAAGILQRSWDSVEHPDPDQDPDRDWMEILDGLTWEHTPDGEVVRDAAGNRCMKHEKDTYERGREVLRAKDKTIDIQPVIVDGQPVMPY